MSETSRPADEGEAPADEQDVPRPDDAEVAGAPVTDPGGLGQRPAD